MSVASYTVHEVIEMNREVPTLRPFAYWADDLTESERGVLQPYFTNLDGPVFALINLPEVVKGALFARYSRSPLSLKRLFLDEFVTNPENGIQMISAALEQEGSHSASRHAETLYRRIFSDYGDDSVAQLGGVHLACEQASNLLTKVLERGRLAAYLEQSTRYIRYDKPLGGRWRYYVPSEIEACPLASEFHDAMESMFGTYATIASDLTRFFEQSYTRKSDSERVWQGTLRAKACDVARGILPVATMSNVGVYANGQAFESMILRMRSLPISESTSYADLVLSELRRVIPAFMARVDVPEKGCAITHYLRNTREAIESLTTSLRVPPAFGSSDFSVELVDWDQDGEARVVADILYASSESTAAELRRIVDRMTPVERASILTAYVGDRKNRRHRPGRAFEATNYHFEIVCDYANFRDLQRHRILTIDWQRITPDHGFTIPDVVSTIGATQSWQGVVEQASRVYQNLKSAVGPDVAQYALPFSSKVRFYLRLNAREAMHLIELRTGKQGHTQYRQVCQRMLELIRDRAGHQGIAHAMLFADMVPDYELTRLDSERRAERRRAAIT
jgi:thymidylate synthase ThyX